METPVTCRLQVGCMAPGRSPTQAQPCCPGLWLSGRPGPLRTRDPSYILRNSQTPEDPGGAGVPLQPALSLPVVLDGNRPPLLVRESFCLPVIAPTHQREAQNFSF